MIIINQSKVLSFPVVNIYIYYKQCLSSRFYMVIFLPVEKHISKGHLNMSCRNLICYSLIWNLMTPM